MTGPLGPTAKTPAFDAGNVGSSPAGAAKIWTGLPTRAELDEMIEARREYFRNGGYDGNASD